MSSHYYLFCEQTRECVEAIACVGNITSPRIEANALQAFLVYHFIKAPGATLVMREDEGLIRDGRSWCSSLEEAAEEFESVGGFNGYLPPIMEWTAQNFRALAARADQAAVGLEDYERAPSGGFWFRRTGDGRII